MFTPTPSSLFLVDPPKKIPTTDEYKIEPKIIHTVAKKSKKKMFKLKKNLQFLF